MNIMGNVSLMIRKRKRSLKWMEGYFSNLIGNVSLIYREERELWRMLATGFMLLNKG